MSERQQKAWRAQPLRKQKVAGKKLDKAVRTIVKSNPDREYRNELLKLQFNAAGRKGGLYDQL